MGSGVEGEQQLLPTAWATVPNPRALHVCVCCCPALQVIFFEPLYDSYVPMARRAGAIPR